MELGTYLAFVLACSVLIIIPGPTVAVVIANSLKHGVRIGMVTVAGSMLAMGILLVLVTTGLGTILENLGNTLTYIKWAGVIYLIYIGYKTWTAPSSNLSGMKAEQPDPRKIFMRGFFVSISNPKALVFFGAFFPQFIDPAGDITAQLALMSGTFFVIALVFDSLWTVMVNIAKTFLLKSEKLVNRISGGFLMLGGGLLAIIKEK